MANTELETLFNKILKGLNDKTIAVETIKETRGTDVKGKDAILEGEWKIEGYTFKYSVPQGKKYGKASVEKEGSDAAVDTYGIDKTLVDIVYRLRNPKPAKVKKESKETK